MKPATARVPRLPSLTVPNFDRRCALLATVMVAVTAAAAAAQPAPASTATAQLVCASRPGERQTCAADTSAGVTLVTVLGAAVCERGKTWDYDATGIWVSEGCSAVFAAAPPKASRGSFGPAGFKLADTDAGDVNLKLMAYVRYLNQQGIDESYTDSFGNVKTVDPRQDLQFQKVNLQFLGWIGNPKLRYLAYVWTANTSQGLGAQVVVGGNLSYQFNRHLRVGGGIYALPGSRTLEGNFPFWLPLDNRLIAEEFFRPSYTMGILAQGAIADGLEYSAMIGNNLSQLGVDAGQLDSGLDALALQVAWMPTTGEFGRGFGDYAEHEKLATRIGAHFTRSDENRQSQPDTEGIENTQIRTSDGNVIFSPGLFGDGINITDAKYQMFAADAGLKYRGLSVESEFYWRTVSNLRGPGTEALPFRDMHDSGFKVETLGDGAAETAAGVCVGVEDLRRVWRPLGLQGRRQLLPVPERARPVERGVPVRQPIAGRRPVAADAGRRQRRHLLQQLPGQLLKWFLEGNAMKVSDKGARPNLADGIDVSELQPGGMLLGRVGDQDVLLARTGDEFFAVGARCTHYHGALAEGLVVGDTVRCPLHHACFSLRTGEALRAPALDPIACWRVERQGDMVFVRREAGPESRRSSAPRRHRAGHRVVIVGGGVVRGWPPPTCCAAKATTVRSR